MGDRHEHEDNRQTAADPQAISPAPPQKLPISDNDPTRDITPRHGAQRMLAVVLSAAALAAMVIATAMVLLER